MPPYLRDVEPSACWNASKMICCFSGEMPMPVSLTLKAMTWSAASSVSQPADQPDTAGAIDSDTWPTCVNLKAFDSRFLMICCSRLMSVSMVRGSDGSSCTRKSTFLVSATCRKVRST